jgi:hypothetical protein
MLPVAQIRDKQRPVNIAEGGSSVRGVARRGDGGHYGQETTLLYGHTYDSIECAIPGSSAPRRRSDGAQHRAARKAPFPYVICRSNRLMACGKGALGRAK